MSSPQAVESTRANAHDAAVPGDASEASDAPIATAAEPGTVREMFDTISRRYDLANRVLSFGVDRRWRRRAARALDLAPGARVLDAATGTGDLAFAIARQLARITRKSANRGNPGVVVGADFAPRMIELAERKARAACLPVLDVDTALAATPTLGAAPVPTTAWTVGDVMGLAFDDDTFDAATIAFGIRNVADPVAGLCELRRVVRPGRPVVVLEFGQPTGPLFGPLYRLYANRILPRVGGWLTGTRAAYEYLSRTSANFPADEAFLEAMREAGLVEPAARPLTFGIAWLYRGLA